VTDVQILLDAPAEPASQVTIAKLGDYVDGRYGEFSITADNVAHWQKNLEHLPGGRALIDLDHRSERKPRNSEAAGWITGVGLDGSDVVASTEWTPVGRKAIEEKRYLFFSPVYGDFKDETGSVFEDTLQSGALTNKPFQTKLPTISLASEETLQAAADAHDEVGQAVRLLDALTTKQRNNLDTSDFAIPEDRAYPIHDLSHARNALARASGKPEEGRVKAAVYKRYPQLKPSNQGSGKSLDSRRSMDAATLIKALDLEEGADDAKILETLERLKAKPEPAKPEPVKTLEQQAADANQRLLDADTYTKLLSQAAAGATAMEHLKEQRFDTAFKLALEHRDGPKVTPAERDSLHHFYTLDADATIKMIEDRAPILPAKPAGAPVIDLDQEGADPELLIRNGIHPGSHELDRAIRAKLHELGKPDSDYHKLLEQFMQNGRLLG
jgi:Mu-like prophage I protein